MFSFVNIDVPFYSAFLLLWWYAHKVRVRKECLFAVEILNISKVEEYCVHSLISVEYCRMYRSRILDVKINEKLFIVY